ncbi:Uncharacterised protein g5869 [Pycnogonum litorale]
MLPAKSASSEEIDERFCPLKLTSKPWSICEYYFNSWYVPNDSCPTFYNRSGCFGHIKNVTIANCEDVDEEIITELTKKLKRIEELKPLSGCWSSTFKITDEKSYSRTLKYMAQYIDVIDSIKEQAKINNNTGKALYQEKLCNAIVDGVMHAIAPKFNLKKQSSESHVYLYMAKRTHVAYFRQEQCRNVTKKSLKDNLLTRISTDKDRIKTSTIHNDDTLNA